MPEIDGIHVKSSQYLSQRLFVERSICLGERTDSGCEKNATKHGKAVFFTPADPFFGENQDEEEPHDDHAVPQKVHHDSHWTRNQDDVYWIKLSYPEHKIKDCNSGKQSHLRSSPTVLCQETASSE